MKLLSGGYPQIAKADGDAWSISWMVRAAMGIDDCTNPWALPSAEACRERFGRVDVLVNNAGILRIGGWQEASEADWRRLFEINLLSVALATRAFLPMLVAAPGPRPESRLRCRAPPVLRVPRLRAGQGWGAVAV